MQDDRLQEVKQSLNQDWLKECYDIYQDELCQMNKNKKQAMIFFEANAALMANQVRSLAIQSLQEYRKFFQRFKKASYFTAVQIVNYEKDMEDIRIEDIFLSVKLQDHENSIIFETPLDEIRQNLLTIIRNIIDSTQSLNRPESGLARSEKSFLWAVPFEDLLVQ